MSKRILIVEDDYGTRSLLARMFRKLDRKNFVQTAYSAEEAYRLLNEAVDDGTPFEIVVADLHLPGSDGVILKDIAEKHHPELDFLFLSGASYEEWFSRIRSHPRWPAFLRKPFSEQQLRDIWETHFVSNDNKKTKEGILRKFKIA